MPSSKKLHLTLCKAIKEDNLQAVSDALTMAKESGILFRVLCYENLLHTPEWFDLYPLAHVAKNNDLDLLKIILSHIPLIADKVCKHASQWGHDKGLFFLLNEENKKQISEFLNELNEKNSSQKEKSEELFKAINEKEHGLVSDILSEADSKGELPELLESRHIDYNMTPLYMAALRNPVALELILQKIPVDVRTKLLTSINSEDKGLNLIAWSVETQRSDTLRIFLKYSNQDNIEGILRQKFYNENTLFHLALLGGPNVPLLKLLFEILPYRANEFLHIKNSAEETPLEIVDKKFRSLSNEARKASSIPFFIKYFEKLLMENDRKNLINGILPTLLMSINRIFKKSNIHIVFPLLLTNEIVKTVSDEKLEIRAFGGGVQKSNHLHT